MNVALVGFLGFLFIGMTLVNRIMEGAFINNADVAILNQISIFRSLDLGAFSIPILNTSFLTSGIPHLAKFDYSYFGGSAGFIQYFLYSITGAMAFGLFLVIMGFIASYVFRR